MALSERALDWKPGATLDGRYEILERLGGGGMGQVHRARDLVLGREVAVKRMNTPSDPVARERFLREAENAALVSSPHVVMPLDVVFTPEGEPALVLQLCAGEPLSQLVRRRGPLSLREAKALCRQLRDAAEALRAGGLVHRDLKPSNILVEVRGGEMFARVIDFGIAKHVSAASDARLTATGQVIGTPEFVSPEQARGEPLDHRSDLHAIVAVVYFALTGRPPFRAGSLPDLFALIVSGRFEPATSVRPQLPKAIDAWFARGLAVDRRERHADAEEMERELARLPEAPCARESREACDPFALTQEVSSTAPTLPVVAPAPRPSAPAPPSSRPPESKPLSSRPPPSSRAPSSRPPMSRALSSRKRAPARRQSFLLVVSAALLAAALVKIVPGLRLSDLPLPGPTASAATAAPPLPTAATPAAPPAVSTGAAVSTATVPAPTASPVEPPPKQRPTPAPSARPSAYAPQPKLPIKRER
jgi:serine/threonine-protein kinase